MGQMPSIKWGQVKSLKVDGLSLCIDYGDGREVRHTFKTKLEMLQVLENRLEKAPKTKTPLHP